MAFWTSKMKREAWMNQLRQCGLGDASKGRNKEVETAITVLLRDVVVPFYNGHNMDNIYLRGVAGGTIITCQMCP